MNIKMGDIANKHQILMNIGKLVLPRKATVAIKRNILQFEEELKIIQEQRNDIVDRYAAKDETGKYILTKKKEFTFANEDDESAFYREMAELSEIEVEVDIMKFDADELEQCEHNSRFDIPTPVQEASIDWMINY